MEASAGKKGFPVWIGDLHSDVEEKELKQRFSGFGSILSCHIKNDQHGRQKNYAYVNFTNQESAERAAKRLAGHVFNDKPIKVKGPGQLMSEGYFKTPVDFRPFTDCTFFVEDKVCKNGENCPYRHHQLSKENPTVCPAWENRKCLNKKCPRRHPGGLNRKITSCEALLASPVSSSVASLSESNSDSLDFEILSDSDEDKDLDRRSHLTGTFPFPGCVTCRHISQGNPDSSGCDASGLCVMESAKNALQRSSFMQKKTSSSVSLSSSDIEDTPTEQDYNGEDYLNFSQTSSLYELDDVDELNLSDQPESFTRLLSLTDHSKHSDYELDPEREESIDNAPHSQALPNVSPNIFSVDHEPKKLSPLQVTMTVPKQLEPVGVFWDIENCSVPVDKSALAIATKMKRMFFDGKREAEFMCVCDINKERKEVVDDLNKAHVTLVHVSSIAKNAADDKLRHSLRKFARTFPPPSTVVLVSGDVNFSPEMNDLHHVHNITTIIVHNRQASEALKVCAHKLFCYEELIEDVCPPQKTKPTEAGMVLVKGLPTQDVAKVGKLRIRLSRLADNCGGKVLQVNQDNHTARILFRSLEWAQKAQKRMNGENVYGSKIVVELLSPPSPSYPGPSHQHPFHPPPPQHPGHMYRPLVYPGGYPAVSGQSQHTTHPKAPFPRPSLLMRPPMPPPPPHPIHPNPFPISGPAPPPPRPYSPLPHYPIPLPPVSPSHCRPEPVGPGPGEINFPMVGMPLPSPQPTGPPVRILVTMPKSSKLQELVAKFTEIRLRARVKSHNPQPFFYNFSTIHMVSEFDFVRTAEMRSEKILLDMYKQKKLNPSFLHTFAQKCLADINNECKTMQPSWMVAQCAWGPEEEEDRRIRSNVVDLLLYEFQSHWAKWEEFKNTYSGKYHHALSEFKVQSTCEGAVELLGGDGGEKEQVVLFSEFSPVKRISPSPTLQKNICQLLSSCPKKRIKLLEFVEAYHERFGPLPPGSLFLQDFLFKIPGIVLKGMKAATMVLELQDALLTAPGETRLTIAAREFAELLKNTPENELPLKRFQQEYQTYFHKSVRVSDILPGETGGMKALLQICPGIKLTDMRVRGEIFTIVGLESPIPPPLPSQVPEGVRQSFRKVCVELLSAVPGHMLPLSRFPSEFSRFFNKPFLLADFKVKKLTHLLLSIPEIVQVIGEGENRCVKLVKGQERGNYLSIPSEPTNPSATDSTEVKLNKIQFQKLAEKFLYKSSKHQVRLDQFLTEWEKRIGFRLTSPYCGHAKFINLLEETKSIQMIGTGPQRIITLIPMRIFAWEMKELLKNHPKGIIFPQIVPVYKEKFKKTFDPATYGKNKLIAVLEEIDDVVKITGEGPRRVAHLVTTAEHPLLLPSPPLSLPPVPKEQAMQVFLDEVTALLVAKKKKRLTIDELSASYYKSFQRQINLRQLGCSSLSEALSKLPNITISGEGPKKTIRLITSAVVGGDGSNVGARNEGMGSTKSLDECGISRQADEQADSKQQPASLNVEKVKLAKSPSSLLPDAKRICSEITRLLLCHSEHAMTLNEIQDSLHENEDPANPSIKDLHSCITACAQLKGSKFVVKKIEKTLILVSLTPTVAQKKLTMDLLYLFVHKPMSVFSLAIKDLLAIYQECYGHALNPKVYNCDNTAKLLQVKTVARCIKFEPESSLYIVKPAFRYMIFTQLACELLFKHGPSCTSLGIFMSEWRNYFGVPLVLSEFGGESLAVLVSRPEVSPFITVVNGAALSHLALTARGLYQEQLRHLLTVHGGRIPLDLFNVLFSCEFARPTYPEITKWLQRKEILPHASQVVNLAGSQWMVWAPTGRPYPDTRLEKQQMVAPEGMQGNPDILLNTSVFPGEAEGSNLEADLFTPIELDSDLIATLYPSEVELPPMITMEDISPQSDGIPMVESVTAFSANQPSLEPMPPAVSGEEESETDATTTTIKSPEDVMKLMEAKRKRGDKIDMEPIIDFLGDLSARELERVEGSIPKPKPSRSRSGRQKPSLAICFPGQSMPPSDADKPSSHVPPPCPFSLDALVADDSLTNGNTTIFGMSSSIDSNTAKLGSQNLKNLDSEFLEPVSNKSDVLGATSKGSSVGDGDYLTDEEKLQAKQTSDLPRGSPPSEWPELD